LEEVCKKKWKTLRDRYRKEKQQEKEAKRSGAGSSGGYKPWRFAAIMSFLNPFMIDRETSSNVPRKTLPPSTLDESQESQPGGSQPGGSQPGVSQPGVSQPGASQPDASQPDASQPAEAGQTGQDARGSFRRKRAKEMSSFEQNLLSAVAPILAMPLVVEEDEDMLFFRSLLPTMRLMSRAKRLRVRFALYKVVLEADQEEE
ncbi:spermidine/spermine N(1)-acetyltransferase-like protein 1, partial [Trematomus bernacchii]|uniref:spermidine/spermine N(1)-acetyltransferase-like protein 1 n=1 Tax=Trematomus bernacchii TaxID=40690 RepID=UPI00146E18B9